MATGDPYIECNPTGKLLTSDSTEEQVANALLVKTAAGVIGIRATRVSAAAADISQYITCSMALKTPFGVLQLAIGESASGKPSLILVEEA